MQRPFVRSRVLACVIALSALLRSEIAGAQTADEAVCQSAYVRSQVARREHRLHEAQEALRICTRDPCPREFQSDCATWLAEVDAAMPSVVVTAQMAGRVRAVRVFVDGRAVDRPSSEPIELDPGEHIVRVEAPGAEPVEQKIVLVEGERARRVILEMPPPKSASFRRPVPWYVFGVGALALGATASFAYFGLSGVSARADLASCKGFCATDDVSAVQTKLRIADVSLGAAVVLTGLATVLFVTRPAVASPRAAPSSAALGPLRF